MKGQNSSDQARGQTIGIIGGGQLGRMLTLAAQPLGFNVVVVNPIANSPAAQVGAAEIVGDLYDAATLRKLADKSDYLTIEIEHLNAKLLEELEKLGKSVSPSPRTIRLIQDKFQQKQFLSDHNVPVADFVEVNDVGNAQKALQKFGGKMLLKTRHGAYDGRGNLVITSPDEITGAFEKFGKAKLYAEAFIPFVKELAVIIARSKDNQTAIYPVVETIHERNICVEVLAPAPVSEDIKKQAEAIAQQVAEHLQGAGVFAIELFLTKDGKILVNEIAPRVHNSGHATIEANKTSQFEQHVRAVTGLPLGDTELIVPAAVMVNILGERNGPTAVSGLDEAQTHPDTHVHIYGKSPTKIDRKMGHITTIAETVEEARQKARNARKGISV